MTSIQDRVAQAVTPELIAAFREEGAVCIKGIFSPDEVAALRAGIDANLAHPSERAKVASRPDDPGWFFEDFCNWQHNDAYRDFIVRSPAPSVAAALMGTEHVRLHHDHLLVKARHAAAHAMAPGPAVLQHRRRRQRQHVDSGRSGAARIDAGIRRGPHLGPWLMPRTFMDKEAKWFPEGSLADLPDIEGDRAAFPIRRWALEAGDMVCFRMLTLHASGGTQNRRRAFSIRFVGDDIRHAPRRWKTSPDFPGIAEQLPDGAPLDHPLFPVVWSRDAGRPARSDVGRCT